MGVGGPRNTEPVAVADWKEYAAVGHRIGSAGAPVTILEFGDFECPACRRFELDALRPIEAMYPSQVAVVFRNWPLPYHKFAYPSARAAECAGDQGRFEAIHDLFYAKQDSLGLKSFAAFARDAGVRDSAAFARCIGGARFERTITADSAAAKRIGGTGTPTLVINGLRLVSIPDSAELDRLVRDALKKLK